MGLEPGKELESALVAVDPSEYIPMLDQIRESEESMRKFITFLATHDPLAFKKNFVEMHGVLLNGHFVNIDKVKDYIKDEKVIMAIKYVREVTGLGLKESKQFVDGYRPDYKPF